MKKYVMLLIALSMVTIPCVMANGAASPRISPQWPVMVSTSYTFDVWAQTGDVYEVKVLLVVTEECYNGMPGTGDAVTVDAVTALTKDDFTGVTTNSDNVPPAADAPYEAASLKDHLSYGLTVPLGASDTIYWALSEVVFDPLTAAHQDLDVTLDSTAPRMLVYLMGNTLDDGSVYLDTRTPPTNPGFMIPEVAIGSIMAVAAMFTALGLYAYKKKHTPKQ